MSVTNFPSKADEEAYLRNQQLRQKYGSGSLPAYCYWSANDFDENDLMMGGISEEWRYSDGEEEWGYSDEEEEWEDYGVDSSREEPQSKEKGG